MKTLVALLCVFVVCTAQDTYETEDNSFKSSALSLEQLRAVARCINDRGPCDRVAASFRVHYPAVIQGACKKCSRDNRLSLCDFYKSLIKKLPEELEAIKKLHDPEGKYWDTFYASVSKDC